MKYALLPLWLLQLFTQSKSFSKNPVIGSLWLNRLGLHAMRMILSHNIMHFRMRLLARSIPKEQRREFFKNGFVVVENLLEPEQVKLIRAEVANVNAEVRECIQGDTLTHRIVLDEHTQSSLLNCEAMLRSDRVLALHKFGSGKNSAPVSYIQTIKNHFVDGPADPQKNLHSDTFHPTMKSWYFIDKVDENNGPFMYLPGSHRLSWSRLKWEYKKSISISSGGDAYSGNGSFRITEDDLAEMGFDAPIALRVPGNTLVMANTHGFHRRGDAKQRSMRTELWSISRSNPFNPFPGFDLPALSRLQNNVLAAYRKHCDKKAMRQGKQSSWHVVPYRNTLADPQVVDAGEKNTNIAA